MKRSRFSEEQIVGILKEHQAGATTADLCRKRLSTSLLALLTTAPLHTQDILREIA